MRLLLVEDEDSIAEPLAESLRREGHDVTRAATGESALASYDESTDLVLLDLRLPDIDGFEVCRQLRTHSQVPIIMTTARGEEIDKVLGLELGADDYVVKPFGVRELLARINAVSRRHQASTRSDDDTASRTLVVGALSVDVRSHRALLNGDELALTPMEFALITELAGAPGEALSRKHLLHHVWNTSWTSSGKTVDVHIAALRRKLGDAHWIETVRGIGYRLVNPQ